MSTKKPETLPEEIVDQIDEKRFEGEDRTIEITVSGESETLEWVDNTFVTTGGDIFVSHATGAETYKPDAIDNVEASEPEPKTKYAVVDSSGKTWTSYSSERLARKAAREMNEGDTGPAVYVEEVEE